MKAQPKTILVIGGDSSMLRDTEDIKLNLGIVQAALDSQSLDFAVEACPIDKLVFYFDTESFEVTNGQTGIPLADYDLIIFKGVIRRSYVAQVATCYLKINNIAYLNGYEQFRAPNKLVQLADMYELGIAMPKTVFSENRQLLAEYAARYLKFPLITKVLNSSGGRGIFKVENEVDLEAKLSSYPEGKGVLVQQFIENTGDLRILLIGGQELIIHRRAKSGHYINNVNQGGDAELVDVKTLPDQLLIDARKLQAQQQLDVAGVDAMLDSQTGEYCFLEINIEPSLSSIYRPEKAALLGELISTRLETEEEPGRES